MGFFDDARRRRKERDQIWEAKLDLMRGFEEEDPVAIATMYANMVVSDVSMPQSALDGMVDKYPHVLKKMPDGSVQILDRGRVIATNRSGRITPADDIDLTPLHKATIGPAVPTSTDQSSGRTKADTGPLECNDCGEEVPEAAKFCPHCGERFDDPSCPNPNCDAKPSKTGRFCAECGWDLKTET